MPRVSSRRSRRPLSEPENALRRSSHGSARPADGRRRCGRRRLRVNPVTGDRDEVLVSAIKGLGDRLVSGQVTPDEWVVRGAAARCRIAPEGAIGDEQAVAVAELAPRVEARLGRPQDIEWALADGRLFLLQARPITTLDRGAAAVPVQVGPPAGYWEREASHFPEPLTPVTRWWMAESTAALRKSFAEGGVLAESIEHTEIGGWVYTRLVPLGGGDPPPLPRWLAALIFPVMTRAVPQFRDRIKRLLEIERSDSRWPLIEQWRGELLAAGRRLVEGGSVDRTDDVFYLEWEEVLDALNTGAGDLRPAVRRRRAERAWVKAHPGPAQFGRRPPPPPPLIGVPREVKENLRGLTMAMELIFALDRVELRQAPGARELNGIPASAGTYSGTARVILNESQFSKIRAGDVLVCPITSPVWSILFPSVSALVTDTGGVLLHSAIIAREYGIPAVVATGNATELVRDGDPVRVDGLRGVVEILR